MNYILGAENDEKWRAYLLFVMTVNISSSGEVEASENMAEYIWNWKLAFGKFGRVSELDIVWH